MTRSRQCPSGMMVSFSLFFFSSRRRHTRSLCDWSSDVCSSDLSDAVVYPLQLALFHVRATLNVKLRDGGGDLWGEDRLLQGVDDRVGGHFQLDGAAFRGSDLDGDERRGFFFRRAAAMQEDSARQEQDALGKETWFRSVHFAIAVVHGVVSTPVNV